MYEVIDVEGEVMIKRTNADGSISYIPQDLDNADYQEYLRSLDEPA
jgi:hypothetical protein